MYFYKNFNPSFTGTFILGTTTLDNAGGSQVTVTRSLDDIYSESVSIRSSQATGRILDFDIAASDGVIFSVDTVL